MTMIHFLLLSFLAVICNSTSLSSPSVPKRKILVTGAAGRTGKLVFSLLLKDPAFEALGLVRTERSAKKLMKDIPCPAENVHVCDVTKINTSPLVDDKDLQRRLGGSDAMVICTSAVPKLSKGSIVKEFLKIPLNVLSGKKAFNFRNLRFTYPPGYYPEKVDYEGQIAQFDLAKRLGIKHIVLVSSMGGTDPKNFLNTIGKKPDGTGNGDILLWKRKAEKHLVNSGIRYTIIHPGGLKDTPGGVSEFILDVDDILLKREKRSISRTDVAKLCIAALNDKSGKSVSLDCITCDAEAEKEIKSADAAFSEFLSTGKSCNYSL